MLLFIRYKRSERLLKKEIDALLTLHHLAVHEYYDFTKYKYLREKRKRNVCSMNCLNKKKHPLMVHVVPSTLPHKT